MNEKIGIKRIYSEVLLGRSPANSSVFGEFFIRHVDSIISIELDIKYDLYLAESLKKLPSIADREKEIIEQSLWTAKEEKTLNDEKDFLKGLSISKVKLARKQEIQQVVQQIEITEKKVLELQNKKYEALGPTAENLAVKQMNEYYIFRCSYKDDKLEDNLFTDVQFDELDTVDINELSRVYTEYSKVLNSSSLKNVSVSPLFLNYFGLCGDNPFIFFGKPVSSLTFFQAELFGYGRFFKSIISEYGEKIPEDSLEDPEKLTQWYNATRNMEKLKDKMRMAREGKVPDVGEAARKAGRDLGMDDILKL